MKILNLVENPGNLKLKHRRQIKQFHCPEHEVDHWLEQQISFVQKPQARGITFSSIRQQRSAKRERARRHALKKRKQHTLEKRNTVTRHELQRCAHGKQRANHNFGILDRAIGHAGSFANAETPTGGASCGVCGGSSGEYIS